MIRQHTAEADGRPDGTRYRATERSQRLPSAGFFQRSLENPPKAFAYPGFASFVTVNLLTVNPIGISSKPTASESLNLAPAKGFGRF